MNWASWLLLTSLLLLLQIVIPERFANRHARQLRQLVSGLALLHLLSALMGLIVMVSGVTTVADALLGMILYDSLSSLMLALVSFVGWVVCQYSIRYLDGEPGQGRYFKWTGFTIGAVSLTILSGNLLGFLAAWMMASLGIHKLLLQYPDRVAAQRAAWTKFAISRIGDCAILAAIYFYYSQFETLDLRQLFALCTADANSQLFAVQAGGWLLAVGAITKSAQIPFHSWMPLAMETPTPVSALMHAGIVNAGGYLMLRTSPMLLAVAEAKVLLVTVGGATAILASLMMITQTAVKKKLAYSTISQMGFMLLQCGLGAYAVAMLHIMAHSLYKAHAFLSSGSVLAQRSRMALAGGPGNSTSLVFFTLASTALVGLQVAIFTLQGTDLSIRPGSLLLIGVFSIGLAQWLTWLAQYGAKGSLWLGIFGVAVLGSVYAMGYKLLEVWLSSVTPSAVPSAVLWWLCGIFMVAFFAAALMQLRLPEWRSHKWLQSLYVHASNGFYFESVLRRWLGDFARS